jgi:hypothetical protein
MKSTRFGFLLRFLMILFFSIGMLSFSNISSGYPQQRIQRQALVIRTLVVSSVEPKEITLLRGGDEVSVTITGTSLNYATSAQVVADENAVTQIRATLSSTWPNPSTVTFKAESTCPAGEKFQLQLLEISSSSSWTVSLEKLTIKVSAFASLMRKTTTTAQATTEQTLPRPVQTQRPLARQQKPTLPNSVPITSSDFGTLTKTFFSDARLTANSCGNVNDYPHQMRFSKPGVATRTSPLGRMDYGLTEDEKKKTTGNFWSGIPLIATQSGQLRTKTIRACIQYWTPELWMGSVANGQMKIQIKVHTIQTGVTVPGSMPVTTPLVKTRRIVEHSYTQSDAPVVGAVLGLLGWMDTWDWKHPYADATIFDYHNGQSWLNVVLSPAFVNGSITYNVVSAAWEMTGGRFMHSHTIAPSFKDIDFGLFAQLPDLPGRILAYNESCKELIRSFVVSVLDQADVKALLSQGLLNLARQKMPSGSVITEVRGAGDNIQVYY